MVYVIKESERMIAILGPSARIHAAISKGGGIWICDTDMYGIVPDFSLKNRPR